VAEEEVLFMVVVEVPEGLEKEPLQTLLLELIQQLLVVGEEIEVMAIIAFLVLLLLQAVEVVVEDIKEVLPQFRE
jgi:hypothetical protein